MLQISISQKQKLVEAECRPGVQICPTLMAENSMILVIEPNIDLDNMEIKDVGKHE